MLHPVPHNLPNKRPIVELIGVTAGYGGQPALTDINLRVNAGDFIGLLGPSGSGKTTLLKIILGAADVYSGTVIVDNVPQKNLAWVTYHNLKLLTGTSPPPLRRSS